MAKHCEYEQQLRHMKMSIEEMRAVIDKHSTIKHGKLMPHLCLAEHGGLEQTHNVLQLPIKLAVFHTDSKQQL